jgi:hypothetical protein
VHNLYWKRILLFIKFSSRRCYRTIDPSFTKPIETTSNVPVKVLPTLPMPEVVPVFFLMDQQGNGAPDRGSDGRAALPETEQADRQGENSVASLPTQSFEQLQVALQQQIAALPSQSLEQHAALQQQGTLMPQGFPPAASYNQQIVENAAVQAMAALIADQASQQQQQQQQQGIRLASGHQDQQAAVASLVSTLSAQQPSNLLGSGTLAAQLGNILPMMLANQQGHPLSQTPAWYNPAMNPAMNYPCTSVGYAAAPGGTAGYRPAVANGNQEAQSSISSFAAAGNSSSNPGGPAAGMPQLAPAAQVGVAASAATRVQRPTVPLFLDYDREVLTEYQCLLRQQIELFEAGPEDIRENVKGRIKPVRVNQLGIRCRHCSMLPPEARARGAVYFAYNVEGIYQLAQNMGKKHLCDGCGEIPTGLKRRLGQMYRSKENNNRRAGGKAYWVESLAVLGVYKDEATGMLRLKPAR